MPIYEFKNNETDEIVDIKLSISEYDQFLVDNPHLTRYYSSSPGLVSGTKSALTTAGSGWQELIGRVKKSSGKDNTIKT